MTKKIKDNKTVQKVTEKLSEHYNSSKNYLKENYKSKKFLAILGAVLAAIILLMLLCSSSKTVHYSYIGDGYVKEIRKGSNVIERFWCKVDRRESIRSADSVIYNCDRKIVEVVK